MLTMLMSIVHRITGAALYGGTLLLAWWLLAAATGPNAYAGIGSFMSSWFGRVILFGYTWALMHHMLGGIRHLIWDSGRGFGPSEREWLAIATLVGSISLTVIIWILGYLFMGGSR
jgi:succinate dehydrogenase / fumarate reductase cytochrome b subunit